MKIIIANDYEDMGKKAANILASQVYLNSKTILGLATGSTPISMYQRLVKIHKEDDLDFSNVTTFNLDEYVGISENDINSYHYFMFNNLFNHINLKRENIHIPNGKSENLQKECDEYEKMIKNSGGIDLQVLGIGLNGHIGFNEPDSKFEALTHVVKLKENTINANSRFFKSIDDVPRYAISMGIKTIMNSRKIILLASGSNKAEIIEKTVYGDITPQVPASILQLHPDVTLILDSEASKNIKDRM